MGYHQWFGPDPHVFPGVWKGGAVPPSDTGSVNTPSNLVGWLILLPTGVGWYIIGYESEPLHSYPELRNCSYSVKLSTPLPRLFLRLVYCVLIPPAHHPYHPQHIILFHAQCIYSPEGHPIWYVCLPTIGVYSDGVDPRGVHRLLYRWILPLSACPTLSSWPTITLIYSVFWNQSGMVVLSIIWVNNYWDIEQMVNHYIQYRLCAIILHCIWHQYHKLINSSNLT